MGLLCENEADSPSFVITALSYLNGLNICDSITKGKCLILKPFFQCLHNLYYTVIDDPHSKFRPIDFLMDY
jgi:hypothetical protein